MIKMINVCVSILMLSITTMDLKQIWDNDIEKFVMEEDHVKYMNYDNKVYGKNSKYQSHSGETIGKYNSHAVFSFDLPNYGYKVANSAAIYLYVESFKYWTMVGDFGKIWKGHSLIGEDGNSSETRVLLWMDDGEKRMDEDWSRKIDLHDYFHFYNVTSSDEGYHWSRRFNTADADASYYIVVENYAEDKFLKIDIVMDHNYATYAGGKNYGQFDEIEMELRHYYYV